jgi:hypothetical protein
MDAKSIAEWREALMDRAGQSNIQTTDAILTELAAAVLEVAFQLAVSREMPWVDAPEPLVIIRPEESK